MYIHVTLTYMHGYVKCIYDEMIIFIYNMLRRITGFNLRGQILLCLSSACYKGTEPQQSVKQKCLLSFDGHAGI